MRLSIHIHNNNNNDDDDSGERDLKDTILWGSTKEIVIKVTEIINGKLFDDSHANEFIAKNSLVLACMCLFNKQMRRCQQYRLVSDDVGFRGRTIPTRSMSCIASRHARQIVTIKRKFNFVIVLII